MKLDQRTRILAYVLAGVVALALLVQGSRGNLGKGGDGGESGGLLSRGARKGDQPLITEVVELALESLQPGVDSFRPDRDPFRFGAKEPPPRPKPRPRPKPVENQDVKPAGPPTPQKPVPPSYDHLEFLGSFGPSRYRIAVIVDGEETHNLAEGDVLDGKFVIDTIGYESVEIGFVGFEDATPGKLAVGGGRETG